MNRQLRQHGGRRYGGDGDEAELSRAGHVGQEMADVLPKVLRPFYHNLRSCIFPANTQVFKCYIKGLQPNKSLEGCVTLAIPYLATHAGFTQPFEGIIWADVTPYLCLATRVSLSLRKGKRGNLPSPMVLWKDCTDEGICGFFPAFLQMQTPLCIKLLPSFHPPPSRPSIKFWQHG